MHRQSKLAMGKIQRIIVHCTAEPDNAKRNREYYRHWFFDVRRWRHFGYHIIVYQDGRWEELQAMPVAGRDGGVITDTTTANGCAGANDTSLHIAYVGGIDHVTGRECDTRTQAQKQTLWSLLALMKKTYHVTDVIGHRDWPGVKKSCPCFDAKSTYRNA